MSIVFTQNHYIYIGIHWILLIQCINRKIHTIYSIRNRTHIPYFYTYEPFFNIVRFYCSSRVKNVYTIYMIILINISLPTSRKSMPALGKGKRQEKGSGTFLFSSQRKKGSGTFLIFSQHNCTPVKRSQLPFYLSCNITALCHTSLWADVQASQQLALLPLLAGEG